VTIGGISRGWGGCVDGCDNATDFGGACVCQILMGGYVYVALGALTVDHARSPASSKSIRLPSCAADPSKVSISSAVTPLDSRNATFFSRGASRIVGSSRNLDAWSSKVEFVDSCTSSSVGVGACTVDDALPSVSSLDSGCCVGSTGEVEGLSAEARCHEGIFGFSAISPVDA